MEVDGDTSHDARVSALEQQVQDLHGQTQALAMATKQSAQETATQVQELRGQLHQQGVHFESALATQAASMQTFQEAFQEQFKQQVHQQQTMLDGMFSKQMTQFEHLLTKRPRQE
jgi:FKBP-type peptidyl-prolyl cis-trans isomerase (trigger factor)